MTAEHAGAHRLAAGTHAAREALAAAEREHLGRVEQRQEAANRAAARTSQREALDREQAALEDRLAAARGESASVAAQAERLTRRVARLADAAEAVRAEQDAAQRRKEADDRLSDAAFKAGFDTPQAAAATLLGAAAQRDLQHRVDAWQAEAAAVADRRAERDAREAAEQPPHGRQRPKVHMGRRNGFCARPPRRSRRPATAVPNSTVSRSGRPRRYGGWDRCARSTSGSPGSRG
ncbi:hypothetical protein Smic_06370 [Streptomyces microflavus]|uniref:Uncharacterized protein n=1 Tax=Streptomyces microflavus TaxID=1919 RepID=A0A7J0CHV6_STRMI|nr:hypothetical protein Smic_06370 [Streptomyces microflavus]